MNSLVWKKLRRASPATGRKLARLLANPEWRRGLRRGVAAAVEHEAVLRALQPATVIDVGANVGQFALLVTGTLPDARLIGFEPQQGPHATAAALFREHPQVELHHLALGAAAGETDIHVSNLHDSSSLLAPTDRQLARFPGTHMVGRETIRVARLDDVLAGRTLAPPVLLKIDVQGFERQVLEGAPVSLAGVDHVYTEVSFVELYLGQALAHEIVDLLGAAGFRLRGFFNTSTGSDGLPIQCDALFSRRKKAHGSARASG